MSHADSPNPKPKPSVVDLNQIPAKPMHEPLPDVWETDAWETVNFPGAISVDAIPRDSAEVIALRAEVAQLQQTNTQLKQDNADLRDRFSQFEQQLHQAQIVAAKLETRHTEYQQDLQTAQERLNQMFTELDLSQQANQRQQILVETLTGQLASAQDRIAELEEASAIAQTRIQDQVQQRLQVENDCRDLRTRLHRQQQQALQFKVALEKCLEMPAVASQVSGQLSSDDTEAVETPQTRVEKVVQLFAPSQPVQPWSAPADPNSLELMSLGLTPKPLSRFVGEEWVDEEPIVDRVSPTIAPQYGLLENSPASLLNLIFPESALPPEPMNVETEEAIAIFDPTPFFVENLNRPLKATPAMPVEPSSAPVELENSDDGTESSVSEATAVSDSMPTEHSMSTEHAMPTEMMASRYESVIHEEFYTTASADDALSLELDNSMDGVANEIVPIQVAPMPSVVPSFDLTRESAWSDEIAPPIAAEETATEETAEPIAGWPSPTLYPQRPAKKRTSLASVELPSFSRAGR